MLIKAVELLKAYEITKPQRQFVSAAFILKIRHSAVACRDLLIGSVRAVAGADIDSNITADFYTRIANVKAAVRIGRGGSVFRLSL